MRSVVLTFGLVASVGLLLVAPGLRPRTPAAPDLPAPKPLAAASPSAELAVVERTWATPAVRFAEAGRLDDALEVLAAGADTVPQADRERHAYLRGVMALRAGRLAEAQQVLARLFADPAFAREHPLAPEAAFRLAEALEAAGESAAAEPYLAWAAVTGSRSMAIDARLAWAAGLHARDESRPAWRAVDPLLATPPPDDRRAAALALAARIAEDAGDADRAAALRRTLWHELPCAEEALALAGVEGRPEEIVARAERLLACGKARQARDDVAALLAATPSGPISDRAELLLARAHRKLGDHAAALKHLALVGTTDHALATEAAYLASRSARAAGRTRDARAHLADAAAGAPCAARDAALRELAAEEGSRGRTARARELLGRLAREAVDPVTRAQAGWDLGWSHYREGRRDEALAALTDVASSAPASREAAAALYWSARILRDRGEEGEALARLDRARTDFPNDYYGLMAREALGLPPEACATCDAAGMGRDLARALGAVAGADPGAAARAAELAGLGLVDDAVRELAASVEVGAAGAARDEALAAEVMLLGRAGRHEAALRRFRKAVPDWRCRSDVPAGVWCACYPVAFEPLVTENAARNDLDPALVFGLIHQESVFDAGARSWANARGLMQIIPSTGRVIARWLGEPQRGIDLMDPEMNVRYGTVYLRRMLDETGHVELALASYNAGGGRVRRWWRQVPGGDVALFVESIPIAETRDYVKAIRWNRELYRGAWLAGSGRRAAATPGAPPVAVEAQLLGATSASAR